MKIKNIFKKNEKTKVVKSNVEKLDAKQLKQVAGGAEESVIINFIVRSQK